ncbi:DUF3397 domain-containing protein [Jeotgalibacillus sp. R-1-5s-1]|uniref:DUF3397 domain-containing protein n=1 Tax=Jeotgalibacillus sp. R-1-5s-1 TaxID=2555897 RepID=UPI00106B0F01|nr:DUF3397 domain-containing protein [Jeotgalibacillus sp. R-1-5s-1]TFE03583.1 DUF3397 domain-containing protein [Jeotgalibacillus sp. R-1-5s-1]
MMTTVISVLLSIFLFIPVLVYLTVFIIVKKWRKDHRKAVASGIHWSVPFFAGAVCLTVETIWSFSALWVVLLLFAGIGILSAIYIRSVQTEFTYAEVLKGMWRLSFLILFFVHTVLITLGVSLSVFQAVN